MAPCQEAITNGNTADYKKVLKPLLERRRRARINRCLDQMKDLMVEALCMEGDSAAKLEKADVLELALRHLQKTRGQRAAAPTPAAAPPQVELDRYRSGFSAAATVVSRALAFTPGVDVELGSRVMQHLGGHFRALDERRLSAPLTVEVPQFRTRVPTSAPAPTTSLGPVSPAESCSSGYSSGADSGLLTVAGAPASARSQGSAYSQASAFTPASVRSQASPQFSPMNLKMGDVDMWRPW